MRFDITVFFRYRIKDLGYPVTDVVFYDISDKEHCDEDSCHWIEQVEVVPARKIKSLSK